MLCYFKRLDQKENIKKIERKKKSVIFNSILWCARFQKLNEKYNAYCMFSHWIKMVYLNGASTKSTHFQNWGRHIDDKSKSYWKIQCKIQKHTDRQTTQ